MFVPIIQAIYSLSFSTTAPFNHRTFLYSPEIFFKLFTWVPGFNQHFYKPLPFPSKRCSVPQLHTKHSQGWAGLCPFQKCHPQQSQTKQSIYTTPAFRWEEKHCTAPSKRPHHKAQHGDEHADPQHAPCPCWGSTQCTAQGSTTSQSVRNTWQPFQQAEFKLYWNELSQNRNWQRGKKTCSMAAPVPSQLLCFSKIEDQHKRRYSSTKHLLLWTSLNTTLKQNLNIWIFL